MDLTDEVAACLVMAHSNQFVLVQYDTGVPFGPEPYAQAAVVGQAWHCEVVSGRYLLPGIWPLDEVALKRTGWTMAGDGAGNWSQSVASTHTAVALMVEGLRFGRHCPDPGGFLVSVESFVSRPGPRGGDGVPLELVTAAPFPVVVAA